MTVNTKACQKCSKIIDYAPTREDRTATCPRCRADVFLAGSQVVFNQSLAEFTVFKSAFGNHYVRYQCFSCGEKLRSPSEEAGSTSRCRFCRVELVIPGATELHQTTYAAQQFQRECGLKMLAARLETTCRLEQAHAEYMTVQKVKELEAIYVQAMSDLGLKKKNSKEMALMRFTELVVEEINKVKRRNWPEFLINETIAEILEVRNGVVDSIVRRRGQGHCRENLNEK